MWKHVTDTVAAAGALTAVVRVMSRESIKLKNIVLSGDNTDLQMDIRINGITHYWKAEGALPQFVEYNPDGGFIVKANSIVQVIATNNALVPAVMHISILYDRIGY